MQALPTSISCVAERHVHMRHADQASLREFDAVDQDHVRAGRQDLPFQRPGNWSPSVVAVMDPHQEVVDGLITGVQSLDSYALSLHGDVCARLGFVALRQNLCGPRIDLTCLRPATISLLTCEDERSD